MPVAKKPSPKGKEQPIAERKVLYPKIEVEQAVGKNAVTVERMKELLGWEELEEKESGGVPELKQLCGKNVALRNNVKNRPLSTSWLLTLRQEHLQKRWRFNGETIVIGRTGMTMSGQHRGLSLILAEIARQDKFHWKDALPEPLTMETLIVYGVPEDDDTFKTLNCGKPSTLDEVLFRSEVFEKFKPKDRRTCSRMTAYAIKLLWDRTGAKDDPFAPRRTHGESLDFLARHPRLLRAVKHIYEENKVQKDDDGKALPAPIGRYVSPGYASAMLYLMGSSTSDVDKYGTADPPSEHLLDWENWDKATEFWTLLGASSSDMRPISNAIAALSNPDTGAPGGSRDEKLGIVCQAWEQFVANNKLTAADLKLKRDEDGQLVETYSVGGIDLGQPRRSEKKKEDGDDAAAVEERKAQVKKEKDDKKAVQDKPRVRPTSRKEVEAEQTRKAREADEELAKERQEEANQIAAEPPPIETTNGDAPKKRPFAKKKETVATA